MAFGLAFGLPHLFRRIASVIEEVLGLNEENGDGLLMENGQQLLGEDA